MPGREWAKAVVCIADDRPVLAVVPAPSRVDLQRLKQVAQARSVRVAHEEEFKALYADCEVGAMPPLGPLYHQLVFVDDSLTREGEIAFNAGSHRDAIRMPYPEFQRLVKPTVAALGTEPHGVAAGSAQTMVTDVVCGTEIAKQDASGRSEYDGETYYFCSLGCKMEFDDNPQAYLR